MKILLILPRDRSYKYRSGSFLKPLRYAPLTLTTLASLVPQDLSAEIKIIDEGIEELREDDFSADLIGITATTSTSLRAYSLAQEARKRKIPVVLGGSHPTLMPLEAKTFADSVVVGLGERVWPRLLHDFKNNKLKKIYVEDGEISLERLPFPRRDLLKKNAYLTINTIQATRGCLHKCTFCAIPLLRRGNFYKRPVREVVREIEHMRANDVLFLDPSPIEDHQYIKELYQALVPLKIRWAGLSTVNIAKDEELLKLAQRSGCKGLLIGFETVFQESLESISKGFNRVDDYKEFIKKLHGHGIGVLGCFMFGFDSDGKDIFERTVEFVDKTKIDIVRYAVLTPFPGTAIFNQLKKERRIITQDWSQYDNEHVVFQPAKMSVEELQEGLHWAWEETYSCSSILKRALRWHPLFWLSLAANIGFRYYGKQLPLLLNEREEENGTYDSH